MRYSFIIPYYNRPNELWNTMLSYRHWYSRRDDIEILVIEDLANNQNEKYHDELIDVLYAYGDLHWIHLLSEYKNQRNPVRHRNYAAKLAKGKVLMLTNPECYHRNNILEGIDKVFTVGSSKKRIGYLPEKFGPDHPQWNVPSFQQKYKSLQHSENFDPYVVCACENCRLSQKRFDDFELMNKDPIREAWYQHSAHNNRRLHWCSFISADNYKQIGGFDEAYSNFVGYDDDDFRETVLKNGINIITRDDLVVAHIKHSVQHHDGTMPLSEKGLAYFNSKWPHAKMIMYR